MDQLKVTLLTVIILLVDYTESAWTTRKKFIYYPYYKGNKSEAVDFCREQKGKPAQPRTVLEYNELINATQDLDEFFYLGLQKNGSSWDWNKGEYPDKWTKWAENEVNNTGEDCAVMGGTNKTWKSVNCNETHQIVCQIRIQKTACEGHKVSLTCPKGEVLNISNAFYGRLLEHQNAVCPMKKGKGKACKSLVAERRVYSRCINKRTCTLSANNSELGEDPCPNDRKYLTVYFNCSKTKVDVCKHYGRKLCGDASCVNETTSYSCFCQEKNQDLVKYSVCLAKISKNLTENKENGRSKLCLPKSPAVIAATFVLSAKVIAYLLYITGMDLYTIVKVIYRCVLTEPDESDDDGKDETDGSQCDSDALETPDSRKHFESYVTSLDEEEPEDKRHISRKPFIESNVSLHRLLVAETIKTLDKPNQLEK